MARYILGALKICQAVFSLPGSVQIVHLAYLAIFSLWGYLSFKSFLPLPVAVLLAAFFRSPLALRTLLRRHRSAAAVFFSLLLFLFFSACFSVVGAFAFSTLVCKCTLWISHWHFISHDIYTFRGSLSICSIVCTKNDFQVAVIINTWGWWLTAELVRFFYNFLIAAHFSRRCTVLPFPLLSRYFILRITFYRLDTDRSAYCWS